MQIKHLELSTDELRHQTINKLIQLLSQSSKGYEIAIDIFESFRV